MNLWATRAEALDALERKLAQEGAVLSAGFDALEKCIQRTAAQPVDNAYARTFGLIMVKAKHFALSCYSLALDGHAQESGAILRLWIEALELLRYLSTDPTPPDRLMRVFKATLPSAGEIGKTVSGPFQPLRKMLNEHASHLGMTPQSLQHLVDQSSGDLRAVQAFSASVLRSNLGTVFCFLYFLLVEALICLGVAGVENEDIAKELDRFLAFGSSVFLTNPNAP